jgi:hypothetical protein
MSVVGYVEGSLTPELSAVGSPAAEAAASWLVTSLFPLNSVFPHPPTLPDLISLSLDNTEVSELKK